MPDNAERISWRLPSALTAASFICLAGAVYLFGLLLDLPEPLQDFMPLVFFLWGQPGVAFTTIAVLRVLKRPVSELAIPFAFLALLLQTIGAGFLYWVLHDLTWFVPNDFFALFFMALPAGLISVWLVVACGYLALSTLLSMVEV